MTDDPSTAVSTILAVMMLAAFALIVGGAYLIARRRERTKGMLMIACAAVLIGNIAILTL